jgi:dipeptidyl-peptidase-4
MAAASSSRPRRKPELAPDGSFILIPLSGRLYVYSRKSSDVTELRPIAENARGKADAARGDATPAPDSEPVIDPQLSPDGKLVGYVRGRDLYVLDILSRRERRLTHSSHPQVTYGLAEFVAQEELHRFSGFFFSPDSQSIAFTEVDNRPVETLYVSDVLRPDLPPQPMRYPRAGTDNAIVRLAVLPVSGKAENAAGGALPPSAFVEWPRDRMPYLATVVWQAGGPLLLTVLSRDQHDLEVYSAEPAPTANGSGYKATRLLSEHDDAWINVDQDVPRVLRDGSGFLWTSERGGGPELELRDLSGRLVRTLVPRELGFRKVLDVDLDAGQLTFAASVEPAEQHIFRMPLLGGTPTQLTREPGYHMAAFGKSHGVYVRQSFSITAWPRTVVETIAEPAQAKKPLELPSAAMQPPFFPKVELVQVGMQAFRAAIIRPRSFQPGQGKKYPVIVDVYGGPHHNQVMSVANRYLLDQWLADHGFIVLAADGRGTPLRGTAWERAIAGNFGDIPLDDQVEALHAAAQRYPEMDVKHVGIFGWSFGGYMAALAVLRRPDVFSAGVAGAPVVDWRDYDTCYTERYLGLPGENKDGYDKSSLLTYARDLRRPLLILHGTADDNVLFLHSLKLSNALFRAGKPHELLPLPGLTHMVPDPLVTERMWTRIVNFLSAALRG